MAALLAAALGVCAWLPAMAATTIRNTAHVSYQLVGGSAPVSLTSNTVLTEILDLPNSGPAQLRFLRFDPNAPGSEIIATGGGQCRVQGGSFGPLPAVVGVDGRPLDADATRARETADFTVGEAIVVAVTDHSRNTNPAVREYVDVDITTTTGDSETLRLLETGTDTGVFAAAIQGVRLPPAAVAQDCKLSLQDGTGITGTYLRVQSPVEMLVANATAHLHIPNEIHLEQFVSKDIVEIGDFIQYTLITYNVGTVRATDVEIRDLLPPGLRYQPGSLVVGDAYLATPAPGGQGGGSSNGNAGGNGARAMQAGANRALAPQAGPVDPVIGEGGRELVFGVGNLEIGEAVKATFVVEIMAGARGQHLINYAIANADGALFSNETDTVVRIIESLNTMRFTIIGRILAADTCAVPMAERKGVPNVRMLLEDGTFAATDADGSFHFEGVRPGTHVLQMDLASIPADMEPAPCGQNTRFAGRSYSQFVEAQGGTLWRGDFYLRPKGLQSAEIGTRLAAARHADGVRYEFELDGGAVPVSKLKAMLMLPEGAQFQPGSAEMDGTAIADPEVSGNLLIFAFGDPGENWRRSLRVDAKLPATCSGEGYPAKLVALFEAGGTPGQRTAPAEASLACAGPEPAASGRIATPVTAAAAGPAASPFAEQEKLRAGIADDATAAGGVEGSSWLVGQQAGHDWLFPAADYNPRSPTTRAVLKYAPTDKVVMSLNGVEVPALSFAGTDTSADKTVRVGVWTGLPLVDGDNLLRAEIRDAAGNLVADLKRTVHYANVAARAQLVPERSILVADGLRRPVIAVRMLDRGGRPVRKGVFGNYTLAPPYVPAQVREAQQQRQLAGLETFKPTWVVEGDDGVAYIELEPTGDAGSANISFRFQDGAQQSDQQVQAWLKSAPRDWVVVGFAKGSVGYDTLRDNMQSLQSDDDGKGVRGEGQAAVYAKGRVLGKWLLTLSYDSDKPTDQLRNQSLLSTIDPGQYYTLYGDGTQQGYDAASASKLYLKLERDQFYALFGDFQTGLDRTELSRYQRTLNGVKVEYRGPLLEVNAFAAKTSQSHVRDEIQGDGTSGLYRLKQRRIVLNSERIHIQTRDRYHSEQILETRELARHIDYDIDYDNGTLFFRQPIASRDPDFNPTWIIAEYETTGTAEEFLNGGGRVGVHAMEGKLEAGASYIRDQDALSRSELVGLDAKFHISVRDELRAEIAGTRGQSASGDSRGTAWLLEWEHRGEQLNLLAYARRQAPGFGLGQQNRYEAGMYKTGVQGQYKLGPNFSLQGEAYRQEDLASGAVRDVAHAEVAFKKDGWNGRAGLQWARDEAKDGKVAESRQVTLAANKSFLDNRLELGAQADFSLPGKNESVDFPTRLQLSAAYKINEAFRIIAAQEFTDGKTRDTSTTRVGFEATPWANARLSSTLNQSQISEYGPRTFASFGLSQKFLVGTHWSFDAALDSSQSFNKSGDVPLVVDPSQPIQAGGIRDGGALTEDFVALSGGATYRTELWSWNARLEGRQGDNSDRLGFTTAFMRQVRDGVALAASAQAFSQRNADGSTGILANAQLSWGYRPLGSNWSMLDKLEYRLDELRSGTGTSIIGQNTIAATGDARSSRIINNFVLNHVSDAWDAGDGEAQGNVLDLYQRSQFSLYYGSKYVLDSFDAKDYSGYTDLVGAEWRFDLSPRIDIGIRASVIHSWSQNSFAWAFGPSVGVSPFTNAWVSVGYNIRGFNDRDFESSHYTAEGFYLVLRMKFDQGTLGLDRKSAAGH